MNPAKTLRVGGVPEHFNLPIHLAQEREMFQSRGLNMEWITYEGGTGQMNQALRNGEVDVCIMLTEGIVTDIVNGNPSKIISEYVTSPLTWGIHTSVNNPLNHYEDIFDKRFAISRWGSGSHLIPIVDANSKGKTLEKEQFVQIQNLDGALESLAKLESDVFYWEKFTTKPYVDSGQLKRIWEYAPPWPCFVIVATDEIIKRFPEGVIRMLRTIHDSCDLFMQDDNAIGMVSERYAQRLKDVERWYHSTEWAIHGWVSDKKLKSIIYHLRTADIIKPDQAIPDLIWRRS